jgi:hypothetical protein
LARAHAPVTPKDAVTCSALNVSRIASAWPRSAPASKVSSTTRRDAGPRLITCARPPGSAVDNVDDVAAAVVVVLELCDDGVAAVVLDTDLVVDVGDA